MSLGSRVSARIASASSATLNRRGTTATLFSTEHRAQAPLANLPILTSTLRYGANPAQLPGPEPMYVEQFGRSQDGEQCG